MNRGYIKLWRKSTDTELHKDHKTWALWTWLLMNVTHKPLKVYINGHTVNLEPGQIITGRKKLAKQTGMSQQSIRTCLQRLQKYENLTIKSTNRFSIISIINWNTYQSKEEQANQQINQHPTSIQPATNHKQECKECKNVKKKTKTLGQNGNHFDRFWSAYPKKRAKKDARKAFKANVTKPAEMISTLLTAIELQKKSHDWTKEGGKYIPYPATWLRRGCWEDECSENKEDKPEWLL